MTVTPFALYIYQNCGRDLTGNGYSNPQIASRYMGLLLHAGFNNQEYCSLINRLYLQNNKNWNQSLQCGSTKDENLKGSR